MQSAWRWCQSHCDMIAVRASLNEAIDRPTNRDVRLVLIAQTNRHDASTLVSDVDQLTRLRVQNPGALILLVRGSLVAPNVALPPNDPSQPHLWVESISINEATDYLSAIFVEPGQSDSLTNSVVIIASQFTIAEAFIDAIETHSSSSSLSSSPRWIAWQRELNPLQRCGNATILWDDSAAPPVDGVSWKQRLSAAPHAKHLWATGIATSAERHIARQSGIDTIIEKPGRLECLVAAVNSTK